MNRRVDDLSPPTPNEYLLYLLAEIEFLLARDRMRWSEGEISYILERLTKISERIAQREGPIQDSKGKPRQ